MSSVGTPYSYYLGLRCCGALACSSFALDHLICCLTIFTIVSKDYDSLPYSAVLLVLVSIDSFAFIRFYSVFRAEYW